MRGVGGLILVGFVLAGAVAAWVLVPSDKTAREVVPRRKAREAVESFAGAAVRVEREDVHVRYDLDPGREKFFVHVPGDYEGKDKWGVIVFMNSSDGMMTVPSGWEAVLAERKLLFVAPQDGGNEQRVERRLGLAVMAALKMREKYTVDTGRVYAAGYSGGARIAGSVAFYHTELFAGTIQSCGSNFPGVVARVKAKVETDPRAEVYGLMDATAGQIAAAKSRVRFVIVTGGGDFRHGNLLDIYEGGYKREGYRAALLDVAEMGHEVCGPEALGKALDFIEKK